MNAKEIFLEMLKPDAKPERLLDQYEAINLWRMDPVNGLLMAGLGPGLTGVNPWGVTITWPADHPGMQPVVNDETRVLSDITRWREFVKAPDVEKLCTEGWEECAAAARADTGDDRLLFSFVATGIFEQCHFLMGFEDTLTNLYEHPKEMHELIDYICDYKLKVLKLVIDGIKPDGIFFHDDWGTKQALFMKPEMWREFFKEPYRRIYGYIRERGCIAIHHADSYMADIVDDMAEIGIQCWQGTLPENNIPALQKQLQGRMILMGGIGAAIDRPDSTEEEIRSYVRRTLEECAPGGHFIPCITYGLAGALYSHVDPIIDDEIAKYNAGFRSPAAASQETAEEKPGLEDTALPQAYGIAADICNALYDGDAGLVKELTNRALEEGVAPGDILEKGLIPGMTRLGDDFSAGEAFVPEMLMGARCMNVAMKILKPIIAEKGERKNATVVLGTIKGDMHDIGKNLVRIMMEGAGFDVIDLGTDVEPERFISTAIEQNCKVIGCSSLLTTSMNKIEQVVELAKQAGIRDKVKIIVGGAPVTQEFCDRIGADGYTDNAAKAARLATEFVSAV